MRLIEFLDPKKPKNVKARTINKSGTQGSVSKVAQRSFETTNGNTVKVMFEKTGDEDYPYDVYFYVNDTMYDRSDRDSEIFPMVLYVIKSYVNRNKINGLTFRAINSENDTKLVRGLDQDKAKDEVIKVLKSLDNYLKSNPKQEVQPSQKKIDLYKKLNRQLPKFYNIPKHDELSKMVSTILSSNGDENAINGNLPFIVDYLESINDEELKSSIRKSHQKYMDAVASNSKSGLIVNRNRRRVVYKKIIDKFFPEWHVIIEYDKFYMSRNKEQ